MDYLTSYLLDLESRYHHWGIYLLGDLNQPNDARQKIYFNLKQIVNFATRGPNTVDKILTNLKDYYDQYSDLHLGFQTTTR